MCSQPPLSPLRAILLYGAACGAWIVGSDLVWASHLAAGGRWVHWAKALLGVVVSSAVLYGWLRRHAERERAQAESRRQEQQRVEHARQLYATLSAVNRALVRPVDRAQLCRAICEVLVASGGFSCAWIGAADLTAGRVQVLAHVRGGATDGCPGQAACTAQDHACQHGCEPGRLLAACARGEPMLCRGPQLERAGAPRCGACRAGSGAAIPFRADGAGLRVLVAYSHAPDFFTADIMAMLADMAADLACGFEAIAERERRAAAEKALRDSEQALAAEVARCRALLEVSVDGVHVVDLEGRLLEANDVFLRERGLTRDALLRARVDAWDAEFSLAQLHRRLAAMSVEATLFETTHRRGDGSLFPVECRAKRVEVDGRAVVYCTSRDVTERKALEQRFLRAQRLESVGLIASGIAHDLNNVLTPILLSTGLLQIRYPQEADAALLKPIEAAAHRGSSIVQQILTFARGAGGQRRAVEPKILLKELSTLVAETFPKSITHRLDVAADARRIIGDPTQLHQVFLNLAVNARDAMSGGGTLAITVRNRQITEEDVRVIPEATAGEFVCITVSDTGTGMTPEVLDHLFEPFFTTKPRGRGTGLGLSTVHGLVRSHGGFIEVNSALGEGSEFRVYLPVAGATVAADVRPEPVRTAIGRCERILVVDDEPAILTVAASVLGQNGYAPLVAGGGDEALQVLEAQPGVAVVLTDVMMPKMDGVQLAKEIRRRWPALPIIAMSGLAANLPEDSSRRELDALGVTALLEKPYTERELIGAIEDVLRPIPSEPVTIGAVNGAQSRGAGRDARTPAAGTHPLAG